MWSKVVLISYLSYSHLSHGMCLYQVMMTLHFLNEVANDFESTQNRKLRHNR